MLNLGDTTLIEGHNRDSNAAVEKHICSIKSWNFEKEKKINTYKGISTAVYSMG